MMERYDAVVEEQMRNLFHSLNEKDRRRYAAIEATKLGHGGIAYACAHFELPRTGDLQNKRSTNS